MIAYNHYIKFIPQLEHHKKTKGTFTDTISVMEGLFPNTEKKLLLEVAYNNNQGRHVSLHTDRAFARTVSGQLWALEVKDIVTFFWYSDTFILKYVKHQNFTERLMEYWCLHIVLPLFFTLEEQYFFLHAGAIEVKGKAILFIAPSFGGKSTMTDFFIKNGHMMISDDKVAVIEKGAAFMAIPSHPHHRPYRKEEDLGFYVENFSTKPRQIQAVYALEGVALDDKITITEIRGMQKFDILHEHSEISPIFQRLMRFEYLMKLAKKTPVFKVKVPWNIARLQEVREAIMNHSKYLK